jgi:hypothetical protein
MALYFSVHTDYIFESADHPYNSYVVEAESARIALSKAAALDTVRRGGAAIVNLDLAFEQMRKQGWTVQVERIRKTQTHAAAQASGMRDQRGQLDKSIVGYR